jgi:hypothetical protein
MEVVAEDYERPRSGPVERVGFKVFPNSGGVF